MRLIPGIITDEQPFSLFCLALPGVFNATSVTLRAVSSYPTFSTLPVPFWAIGGLFSAALSVHPLLSGCPLFSQGRLPSSVRTFLNYLQRLTPTQRTATVRETAFVSNRAKRHFASKFFYKTWSLRKTFNPRCLLFTLEWSLPEGFSIKPSKPSGCLGKNILSD